MTSGGRAGDSFRLRDERENRIGRGLDCEIVLADPLCSRVHAVVACRRGSWVVRDNRSLNGTFVNDAKIDEATLAEGCYVRLGSTEFTFHRSLDEPAPSIPDEPIAITQTLVRDSAMSGGAAAPFIGALADTPQVARLLLLLQLAIRLLGKDKSEDVLRAAMEDLLDATQASLVGYLRINDEGRFTPRLVLPETEDRSTLLLSNSLTETVYRKRNGVWLSDHLGGGSVTESLQHFADAMCFPLVHDQQFLGAMHVYRAKGRFDQDKFEFAKSVANIVAQALGRAYREELLQSDFQRLKAKTGGFDELIGECAPMIELKSKIQRLSRTTGSVLVRGESGAGKELVARALHKHSTRADRPMLTVNCAAIPEDLMESQLFGHKAGSFTGADNDHRGYFQQADGGTLFLDEVGELTLAGQAKLLRILEGHPFLPVGSTEQVRVDVRVIAATNQDLQSYVREKRFREDLYYRLSVFELAVPPLRERGEDLRRLIDYFLDQFRSQHGRPNLKLSTAARQKLMTYHWPGNVRQLRNVLDSAVVLAGEAGIEPSDLGLRDAGDQQLASLRLDDWERKLIVEALARTSHNIPEAAKLLGLGRATLYRKLTEYGLGRSD